MFAIYKRELRSYFQNVIGWLFIAATLALIGLYFSVYNLVNGYAYFSYALGSVTFLFLISVPILTMRILAEERKQKTDQLILTAPVSVWKIVLGKYLAMLSVFGISIIIICAYPLIMSRFGSVPMGQSYNAILGYFLMGAFCIAIGMFISSLTESQVIAGVLSFVALFLGYMMNSICSIISSSGNLLTKILGCYDLSSPLNNFLDGIFDLGSVIYYISVIILFLFLTVMSIQKRRWDVNTKNIKTGAYSTVIIVIAVAAVVFVNLIIRELPVDYTQYDITSSKLYSLTDTTKNLLKSLEKDVTIYVIAGEKNQDETVEKTLKHYEDASSHVKVVYKDPTRYPNFTASYSDSVTENSLIVESGEMSKVVDYNSMYVTEVDYSTYQQNVTGYDAEGQITSAISYVTNGDMPTVYMIQGQNEYDLGSDFTEALKKNNIFSTTMNLMDYDAIPEDADCIIINGPQNDFSEADTKKIMNYLDAGNKAVMTVAFTENELPNYNSIMKAYGVTNTNKIIFDLSDRSYYQNPYWLLPQVESSEATKGISTQQYILATLNRALIFDENEVADVTCEPLLTTSDAAYAKEDADANVNYEYEEGKDLTGPFNLGMILSKTQDGGSNTEIALFSSGELFEDEANAVVSGANAQLFSGTVNALIGQEEVVLVPAKSYEDTQLMVSNYFVIMISVIVTLIIPIIMLIVGVVIWYRRRKR